MSCLSTAADGRPVPFCMPPAFCPVAFWTPLALGPALGGGWPAPGRGRWPIACDVGVPPPLDAVGASNRPPPPLEDEMERAESTTGPVDRRALSCRPSPPFDA